MPDTPQTTTYAILRLRGKNTGLMLSHGTANKSHRSTEDFDHFNGLGALARVPLAASADGGTPVISTTPPFTSGYHGCKASAANIQEDLRNSPTWMEVGPPPPEPDGKIPLTVSTEKHY
ncbi:hypothetical protein NLJ89_g10071 [Agrocybe chaxingu]|uniref:Uncharacterized protein n=1 Tax=Agrocybe chaxingu TaxID=84603 RepID=A0A9W8JZE1_9AGAR|nr:hypothetical protein NLJ89_g10071 [Agrocybe chaxingu]